MSLEKARWIIFAEWAGLLIVFCAAFLIQSKAKGIRSTAATEAVWTSVYIILPVLLAFAGFYLGPNSEKNLLADAGRQIRCSQFAMAMAMTVICHGIVIAFFCVTVWCKTFNFDTGESYTDALSMAFKLLLLFGAGPMIAVNFLLGRSDVAMGDPAKVA